MVIEVQGGEVVSSNFQATEFRGFKHFVQGVPAEEMVVIVPRICGVCSTAHHVASVKTLEDAFGVAPPPLALRIRELLLLGQMIQSQATSLFIFTMPDRLGTTSIFEGAGLDFVFFQYSNSGKCVMRKLFETLSSRCLNDLTEVKSRKSPDSEKLHHAK